MYAEIEPLVPTFTLDAPLSDDPRRESPRVPLDRIVARLNGASVFGSGDVSVGGALWVGAAPTDVEGPLELSFRLPGDLAPLHVRAEPVARERRGGLIALHLRFIDPPLEVEWRIACFIDDCRLGLAA